MIMIYKYIQLSYLDTIAGDDPDLRQTLLEMVSQELSSALPQMKQALEQQNWDTLHEIVHKLKSTLAFIGNPELSEANQRILSNLENKNFAANFGGWLSVYGHLAVPIQQELQQELEHLMG